MDMIELLDRLEDLEKAMSDMYAYFATLYRNEPGALELFETLRDEEISHMNTVRYQHRIVKQNKDLFGEVDVDTKPIETAIATARRVVKELKQPPLARTLEYALKIESSAVEYHYRTAMAQANPEVGRLVTALGDADKYHVQKLRDFMKKSGRGWTNLI